MEINVIEILTYFIVYSFLGWVIESSYKSILQKSLINSGFLHGPFCPIYGIGALIMFMFLNDFKGSPFLVFCLGFFVLSVWEYIVGVLLEKIFKTRYWDYSHHKYNLQGRVCLTNSIFWGILGVVFITYIHPFVQLMLSKVQQNYILYADIVLSIYLLTDMIISIIKIKNIDVKIKKLDEINNKIKERLQEIKEYSKNIGKTNKEEHLQSLIDELRKQKDRMQRRIYRNVIRLRKAFPSMKSEKITEFLNNKVETKKKQD